MKRVDMTLYPFSTSWKIVEELDPLEERCLGGETRKHLVLVVERNVSRTVRSLRDNIRAELERVCETR